MALMFLPSAGAAIGVSSAESLFLSRVGAEALPELYIALGLVTVMATLGMTALLGRVAPAHAYLIMPVVLAGLLGAARFLVEVEFDGIYRILWVTVFLIDTFGRLVIWGIAGMTFDTRQAKRLYPLFVASGILGFSVGGLATSLLVRMLGTENLLLAWAVLLLATLVLARAIARRTGTIGGAPMRRRRSGRLRDDLQAGFQYVRHSRLLFWTAVSAVLFQALYFLLAFPFSRAVEMTYPVEDEMTAFLGVFRGVTTGSALLVSVLVATRFNARYGLMAGFLALAVFDLIGFSAMSIASPFAGIVAFRYLHETWQSGITRTAWFALFNVVPPVRREQTRLFINGVCLQAGVVLVGVTLLVGREILRPQQLFVIGAVTASLALLVVFFARRAYLSALVDALRAGRPQVFSNEEEPFAGFQQDASAMNVAMAGLADPDPAVRRLAADILSKLAVPEAAPALVDALSDRDVEVRVAVLPALGRLKVASARDDVIGCLSDPEAEIRAAAVATLGQLGSDTNDDLPMHLQPLLDDPVPAVRATAATTLLGTGPDRRAEATLRGMAHAEDTESRVQAVNSLHAWHDEAAYEIAAAALRDPQPTVRRAAAATLAHIDDGRCPGTLVAALGDPDRWVREALAESLCALGEPALAETTKALDDPELEDGALLALEGMRVDASAEAIRAYARGRIGRALHYHDLWRQAQALPGAGERGRLLLDALHWLAHYHGTNVLRALASLEDGDAVGIAIDSLGSGDPVQIANAVEALDSIADRDIVRPLLRLWDPVAQGRPTDARGRHREALRQSLQDKSGWLRACAALAADGVDDQEIRAILARLAETDSDVIVRETAAAALEGGRPMETLHTLSIMQRILFLKRVPLFAKLPPAELKQVATIAEEHLFCDGEVIADQGEPGDELYVIVSGQVRVAVSDDQGETDIALRGAGEYVGEMAVISHRPRMARLVADGDVRVLCIGQKQFEGILRERPETSLAVMRMLCDRLRERETAVQ